ncbi:DUF3137 domain-containing protein [Nocardia blacklockiae]|uniref:DUF3137 domain-containing protein n=1 Tax=Nocardia blacklockiae TaxID=480036 RepID=UPI001E2AF8A2|nr:DUF3137 domain-containing protein [Nocardia blacklockiae]
MSGMADDESARGPIWALPRFLNTLTFLTFSVLVVVQGIWWRDHGEPFSWVLLPATPLLAFLPSGLIVKSFRKRWTARWAEQHGFSYQRAAGWAVPAWNFPPFTIRRARRMRVRDAMRGTVGAYPASFFHLTWLNNNRINVSTHYRNVFVLELPTALPRLTMGPNFDTTAGTQVRFESAEFNDKFAVYSSNPAFAHAVFTPRTIDRLIDLGRQRPAVLLTKFEITGNYLVGVTTLGNRPLEITSIFDAMRVIAEGIPRFVWSDSATTVSERNVA